VQNTIHPTAVIHENVKLGSGNWIGPYVVIMDDVAIGDDNWIGPHAVIGAPPEHRSFHWCANPEAIEGKITIGSRNVIHEHAAIQAPTTGNTSIGDDCLIMHGVHIAHDVQLGNWVTIAPGTVLAGHSAVGERATLGIGVAVHQSRRIGPLAMVGMHSTIVKDVNPFALVIGTPARFIKANLIGIERAGIPLGLWVSLISQPYAEWQISEFPAEVAEILSKWPTSVVH
jgi:UDP-N-acetylglucosamine acyltransferase